MNNSRRNNEYRVVKNFITDTERELLLKKANYHFDRKEYTENPAGPHRFMTRLDKKPQLDSLVKKMTNRVRKTFGLKNFREDPILNKLISRIEPGGFIHQHTDTLQSLQKNAKNRNANNHILIPDKGANFRCNIMVKMSDQTACPVIGNTIVDVSECDAWGFLPSTTLHGTQVITGGTRIIFGFGFFVPEEFEV